MRRNNKKRNQKRIKISRCRKYFIQLNLACCLHKKIKKAYQEGIEKFEESIDIIKILKQLRNLNFVNQKELKDLDHCEVINLSEESRPQKLKKAFEPLPT